LVAGVEERAYSNDSDRAFTSARACGAPYASDVGAALAHDRQVVGPEPARERNGQRSLMRPFHPRGKRRR
jgi:hypothetical protein